MCVVYNDSDWPTTSENEEEANREEGWNTSNRVSRSGNASKVVRAQPLGLLSVRMREYEEKQKFSGGKSDNGQFASSGMLSVPFPFLEFYSPL